MTPADLSAAAQAYNPKLHEAPIWIEHKEPEKGNRGLIKSVSATADKLFGEAYRVDAKFAEDVNSGRFPRVSPCFYEPTNPHNPVPGVYYLKELSFCQIPAVKGMAPPSFAEGLEEGTVAFADWMDRDIAMLFRGLRDWMIEKFSLEEADRVLPGYVLEGLVVEAMSPTMTVAPLFSEISHEQLQTGNVDASRGGANASPHSSSHPTQPQTMPPENDTNPQTQEAQFSERERQLAEREAAIAQREALSFAEGLIKEGRLTPGLKNLAVALLCPATEGTHAFGEGTDRVSGTQQDLLKQFLAKLPQVVTFGEVVKGQDPKLPDATDPKVIAERATEYRNAQIEKGNPISFAEAVTHVTRG